MLGAALLGGMTTGVALTAAAASGTTGDATAQPMRGGPGMFGAGVRGTVSAVNGSTLTVTGEDGGTYTIDASGAKVEKYANGATSAVTASGIAVGDTVMVSGKITSAAMTANDVRDGVFPKPTPPAAMGKVTAVSGSTITLSGMGKGGASTTYTVDASGATVTKVTPPQAKGDTPTETTISVSGISAGDMLVVEGAVNGSSVAATSITDGAGMGMGGRGFGGSKKNGTGSGS